MDYTNFVKTYYRTVLSKCKQYPNYSGVFAELNYGLEIPEEFMHKVSTNCDYLPNFELNIDAPAKYFVDFLQYYCELMPSLKPLFLGKELNERYNFMLSKNYSDELQNTYISFTANVGLDVLVGMGVLK